MAIHNTYCFRVGCMRGIDSPEKTRISRTYPTRGPIGGAALELTMEFCSPRCAVLFFEEYDTPEKVWNVSTELVRNALALMPKPVVVATSTGVEPMVVAATAVV